MKRILILFALVGSATGGEYALLSSGARLHAERHEFIGSFVRLYSGAGMTQLPAELVRGFEIEEYTPPAASPAKQPAAQTLDVHALVDAAAKKHGLPPELVHSVVAAESGYRSGAISPKGAVGLMQLMPATARDLGVEPADPGQNVDGGTQYLRDLLIKYDGRIEPALAAYNAGPGAVDKYGGVPPYRETRNYVERVTRNYLKNKKQLRSQ